MLYLPLTSGLFKDEFYVELIQIFNPEECWKCVEYEGRICSSAFEYHWEDDLVATTCCWSDPNNDYEECLNLDVCFQSKTTKA